MSKNYVEVSTIKTGFIVRLNGTRAIDPDAPIQTYDGLAILTVIKPTELYVDGALIKDDAKGTIKDMLYLTCPVVYELGFTAVHWVHNHKPKELNVRRLYERLKRTSNKTTKPATAGFLMPENQEA